MSISKRVAACLAAMAAALVATAAAASATGAHDGDLGTARVATAEFNSLVRTDNAGYAEFRDKNGIACIADDVGGTGAMGVHYVNGSLVDGALDVAHPEALVYAPDRDGGLHLAALEYIVPASAVSEMPSLFGEDFMFTPDGNRFGLPAFWSLHVWVWQFNPAGTFAMFNPDVHCPS